MVIFKSKVYADKVCIPFINVGGGVALLYASKELDKLPTSNFDQKIGVQIIQNALKVRYYWSLL